jgi:DNA-binding NtrC family response regulator
MARIVIVAGTDAGQDVAAALSAAGHQIVRAESLSSPAVASQGDVIFIEPWLYAADQTPSDVPVVLLTNADGVASAVEAVRNGAYDLLRVPCTRDEVRLVAQRALRYHELVVENEHLRQQLQQLGRGSAALAAASTNRDGGDHAEQGGAGGAGGGDNLAVVAKELAGKPLADIEKQVILRTLEQFKGHRLRTAAALGIGVRTLGMKIKRWREEGEPIAGRHHGHAQQQQPVHVDVS